MRANLRAGSGDPLTAEERRAIEQLSSSYPDPAVSG
jgi:hypothetical protein